MPCGLGLLALANQISGSRAMELSRRLPCLPRDSHTSAFLVLSRILIQHPTLQSLESANFYYYNKPTNTIPFNHCNHGRSWNQQEGGCQTRVQDLYGDHCVNSPYLPYCSTLLATARVLPACLPVLTIQTARLPVCGPEPCFSNLPTQFMNTNIIYPISSRVYATEGYGFPSRVLSPILTDIGAAQRPFSVESMHTVMNPPPLCNRVPSSRSAKVVTRSRRHNPVPVKPLRSPFRSSRSSTPPCSRHKVRTHSWQ